MYNPLSTYRIQLNSEFGFGQLEEILNYLYELGVSTVYASPITKATKGSMHGYDVTSPLEINDEIGTAEQLQQISDWLKQRGMGWLQDIVPNHMAYSMSNSWLYDFFERGNFSEYSHFFDAGYYANSPVKEKIMAPFLGKTLTACLQDGEIRLGFGPAGFSINYFDKQYPVATTAYDWICSILPEFSKPLLPWAKKMEAFSMLPREPWCQQKEKLIEEVMQNKWLSSCIEESMDYINSSTQLLEELLGYQYYLLCSWRLSTSVINYRRFFTVNELICIRMEDESLYNAYHQMLFSLYQKGLIQGFRLDHIDGLYEPGAYVGRLRNSLGDDCYIVAEKILQQREELPNEWPLQGTTGYDFLAMVNQLFTHDPGKQELTRFYQQHFSNHFSFEDIVFESKYRFLKQYMEGELNNLLHLLIGLQLIPAEKAGDQKIREALAILMAAFPVYRIYFSAFPLPRQSKQFIEDAFAKAIQKQQDLLPEMDLLKTLFVFTADGKDENRLLFLKRLMQFTGPLAAKGTEDTAFYVYNAFIAHNEVGDSPGNHALSVDDFHENMLNRQLHYPLSLNAGSTHDTKRGEDGRMRLNMLSIFPREWMEAVTAWQQMNRAFITEQDNRAAPDANDEYFIYQSLVSGFPADMNIDKVFLERFQAYITKALRESKRQTRWDDPDEAYENNCQQFIGNILCKGSPFLAQFLPFIKKIADKAGIYSLAQLLIRLTAPGVPDIYQGSELWDFSFVDPDNRRPVDYQLRKKLLKDILDQEKKGPSAVLDYIDRNKDTGVQKLWIIQKALACRRKYPLLFSEGSYIPLQTDQENVLAYMRMHGNEKALVIVPLPCANTELPADFSSTEYRDEFKGRWVNPLTGDQFTGTGHFQISGVFSRFPAALFLATDQ